MFPTHGGHHAGSTTPRPVHPPVTPLTVVVMHEAPLPAQSAVKAHLKQRLQQMRGGRGLAAVMPIRGRRCLVWGPAVKSQGTAENQLKKRRRRSRYITLIKGIPHLTAQRIDTHPCAPCAHAIHVTPPLTCGGAEGTHVASTLSQRRDTTGPGDCSRRSAPRDMK